MRTSEMRKQLHQEALICISFLDAARERKDSVYDLYRSKCHESSKDEMTKLYRKLESLDGVIDKFKNKYNKIIQDLCMLQ